MGNHGDRFTASPPPSLSVSNLLLFFVMAALYLVPFSRCLVLNGAAGDEGIYVYEAKRVLDGEVMYRDFFNVIGPGPIYLHALAYLLLGPSLVTVGLVGVVLAAASATLTCALSSRYVNRRLAILAGVCVVVTVFPGYPSSDHHRWTAFFALAVAQTLTLALDRNHRGFSLLAGLLLGAQTTCVHTTAVGVTIMALLATALCNLPWRSRMQHIGVLLIGWMAVVGATLLAMWRAGAWDDMVYACITYVAQRYIWLGLEHFGSIPFYLVLTIYARTLADRFEGVVFLALTVSVVVIPWTAFLSRGLKVVGRLASRHSLPVESIPLLFAVVDYGMMAPAWNHAHFMHVAPLFMVVVVIWMRGLYEVATGPNGQPSVPSRIIAAALPVAMLVAGGYHLLKAPSGFRHAIQFNGGSVYTGSARLAMQFQELVPLVNRLTKPDDPIFVYPWGPLYYFLLQRRNPVPNNILAPSLQSDAQFAEVLARLNHAKPRLILRERPDDVYLKNLFPAIGTARDPMFRFIRANYTLRKRLPDMEVWERQPG